MSHQILINSTVIQSQIRTDIPEFSVGSLVEVSYKIIEGTKERIQVFKGIVTNKHNKTNTDATFTVLKNSTFKTKAERTFPINSPLISSIKVTNLRRARRANVRNLMDVKDPTIIRSRSIKPKKTMNPEAVKITMPIVKEAKTSVE
jgi:large subunit ribosomal protein L19